VAKAIKFSEKNKAEPYLAKRFLAAADFTMPEIHYFWSSQNLQRSKYTISSRRGFCSARNTLFLAVAVFATPEIHYF